MPNIIDTSLDFTSRYYLIEAVDEALAVYGENCLIRGCNIQNLTFVQQTKILNFKISPGLLIVDKKLIKFPEEILMQIDLSSFPTSGVLLPIVSYRYLRTTRPNLAIVNIKIVENNICQNWWEELDKFLISSITYDINLAQFNIVESDCTEEKVIMVNGSNRVIRQLDNFSLTLRDFYQNHIL